MSANQELTLHPEAAQSLVSGFHGAPFDVLGIHAYEDGVIIRVFEPEAISVNIIPVDESKEPLPMVETFTGGLFELVVTGTTVEQFLYELEITYSTGVTVQQPDLYRFPTTLTDYDRYLIAEGTDIRMYDKLGAHLMEIDGYHGVRFAVWAPSALRVSVVGDFNMWDGRRHVMRYHPGSGLWEIFIPGLGEGTVYKYEIKTHYMDYTVNKSDPVGFYGEVRPNNASVVWDLAKYTWQDDDWISTRQQKQDIGAPINIYEVHLGSWQRAENNDWISYEDMIDRLVPYLVAMGYTHVELLPVAEHPFDGSWGYQVTNYFAATSRFGTPDQFMQLVDACHQAGIGVILDWVPAHFPKDQHGLGFFDGTHLYEHADPRQGEHPDWGTLIFNYARYEVRQFLISNALFWIEKYHIDGLRVDAVASMLYLDFSREQGQWVPNIRGGRENLGAIEFLKKFNDRVHEQYPGVITIAEESTDWPGVTAPTERGGLGFDLKWNMGWMHDTLQYMSMDPVFRAYHHGTLTFSMLYAFSEKFVLPFSHDEVVHLKKNMLDKMPGDVWQKFANLRALFGYQYSHPGKKLMFMGMEFGQWREWTEEYSLDWHLVQPGSHHAQLQQYVKELSHLYKEDPALHSDDLTWAGFEWLEVHDSAHSILAYVRRSKIDDNAVVVVCNFTPVVREGYRLGVPYSGDYMEVLSSDDTRFGGSGVVNEGALPADDKPWRGQDYSIRLTLPPLGVTFLKPANQIEQTDSAESPS
ncbi:MAG: 1,4-alpha-glucan branching protein GlgB [Anaerolineae bacterium]|nr:1,4-alpha-glucan branching protein GlgB [Anaerolineae bacterium]MCO5188209.1 1,4-alpha-glucan branching protein GlgB [Anaerolineae bacterium]MCO5194387.1 1,4-alpha-glucan branching protein GlgB [Anaerolineae bacterium]MCO5198109.1 1,4-alpha-glucan branching protein GlgB [Anaerolineae bacterium]